MTTAAMVPTGAVPAPGGRRRVLLGVGDDLDRHDAVHGPRRLHGPAVIDEVARSGLTGRGGAAFPVAAKLATARDAMTPVGGRWPSPTAPRANPSRARTPSCWADAPHLVLDGLAAVASAVGATECVVYVPGTHAPRVRATIAARAARGRDRVVPTVVEAPDRFVAGETTAVVDRVAGGRGSPGTVVSRPPPAGFTVGRPSSTTSRPSRTSPSSTGTAPHGSEGAERGPNRDRCWSPSPATRASGVSPSVTSVRRWPLSSTGTPSRPRRRLPRHLGRRATGPVAGTVRAVAASGRCDTRCRDRPLARRHVVRTGGHREHRRPPRRGERRSVRPVRVRATGAGRGVPRSRDPRRCRAGRESGASGRDGRRPGACAHPDGTARLARSALTVFTDDIHHHAPAGAPPGHQEDTDDPRRADRRPHRLHPM